MPNTMFKFRFSIRYMLLAVSLIAILLAVSQSERGSERTNRRVASLDFSGDGSELAVALYQHQDRDADLERDFRRTISVMNGETLSDSRVLYRDRPRKWTFFESDRFDEIGDKKWISENAREFSEYHTTRFWKTQSQIEYSNRKVFLIRGIPWQLTTGLLVVWAWVFWRTITRARTSKRQTDYPAEQRLSDDGKQTD